MLLHDTATASQRVAAAVAIYKRSKMLAVYEYIATSEAKKMRIFSVIHGTVRTRSCSDFTVSCPYRSLARLLAGAGSWGGQAVTFARPPIPEGRFSNILRLITFLSLHLLRIFLKVR